MLFSIFETEYRNRIFNTSLIIYAKNINIVTIY